VKEFAESDWAKWWGAIDEVDDRNGGSLRIPGRPWRFSADALEHPGVPAFRGEHNREVLEELGYPPEAIDLMTLAGALSSDIPKAGNP
jgi:crotonobetainyl-CoA:carnitine CoA-transferase CaiB-like acyl-CoA transferase